MMPQAGGQYVYLREAYGPLTGYLCGWSFFIAAQTGGISVLAVGFAEYTNEFLPLTPWEQKAAAAASIAVLTAINYRRRARGRRLAVDSDGTEGGRHCRDHPAGLRAGEGIAGRARRARGAHGSSLRGFFRGGDGRRLLGLRRLECLHVCGGRSEAPGAQRAPGVDPGNRGGDCRSTWR